jgi:hypothetical protein
MNQFIAVFLVLSVVGPSLAQDVAEPRSVAKFAPKDGDTSLLGVGLRPSAQVGSARRVLGL